MRILIIFLLFISNVRAVDKVVSTSPAITEIISALGAKDKLVGISNYCKLGDYKRIVPRVGTALDLDFETVVRSKPDLVILSSSSKVMLKKRLEKLKLNLLWVKHESYRDILDSIGTISKALNESGKGGQIVNSIKSEMSKIEVKSKKVLIVVGSSLSGDGIKSVYVAGKGSFYDDILNNIGMVNVATQNKNQYPVLNVEQILKSRPDYVIQVYPGNTNLESVKKSEGAWKAIKHLNSNVTSIVEDYAVLPGPGIGKLAHRIKEIILAKNR